MPSSVNAIQVPVDSDLSTLLKDAWMEVLVDVPLWETHEDELLEGIIEQRENLGIGTLKTPEKDWVVFFREPKTGHVVIAAGPFLDAGDATAALISRVANDRVIRLLAQRG